MRTKNNLAYIFGYAATPNSMNEIGTLSRETAYIEELANYFNEIHLFSYSQKILRNAK